MVFPLNSQPAFPEPSSRGLTRAGSRKTRFRYQTASGEALPFSQSLIINPCLAFSAIAAKAGLSEIAKPAKTFRSISIPAL